MNQTLKKRLEQVEQSHKTTVRRTTFFFYKEVIAMNGSAVKMIYEYDEALYGAVCHLVTLKDGTTVHCYDEENSYPTHVIMCDLSPNQYDYLGDDSGLQIDPNCDSLPKLST